MRFLGRSGEVTAIRRGIGALPAEERPTAGKVINAAVERMEGAIAVASHALERSRLDAQLSESIDVTLPGPPARMGSIHPIRRVMLDIGRYFTRLGFAVLQGPEIETDANNFDALNIPPDHPAREGLDSFYLRPDLVLRTHTSPMQIRAMRTSGPPIAVIVPGKAYLRPSQRRVDRTDARAVRTQARRAFPAVIFSVHGTECRDRHDVPRLRRLRHAQRRDMPHLRRLGLDRDRRLRNGASERVARGRLRSRYRRRLGLRLRPRAHRNGALRDERHPRLRRKHAQLFRANGVVRVPISWLRDYVQLPVDADAIVARLATLGFPVDAVETRPAITGVVVGRITKIEKHPNADRLQICTIDIGTERMLTIATAATRSVPAPKSGS